MFCSSTATAAVSAASHRREAAVHHGAGTTAPSSHGDSRAPARACASERASAASPANGSRCSPSIGWYPPEPAAPRCAQGFVVFSPPAAADVSGAGGIRGLPVPGVPRTARKEPSAAGATGRHGGADGCVG